jgi:putative oxidoreductase
MSTIEVRANQYRPQMLSILRIAVGLFFLYHGTMKWFGIPAPIPEWTKIQLLSMLGLAGVIEIVCGALMTVGLFTRYAAFIASGEMAYAYLIYSNHSVGFGAFKSVGQYRLGVSLFPIMNEGSLEVLLCFVFLYLFFAGAGPWSLDAWRNKP